MSSPSRWPLPPGSYRWLAARKTIAALSTHPLSHSLYPLACGFYKKAAQHKMLRHQPDDYLLLYCIEGSANLLIESNSFTINSGDLLILPKTVSHSYEAQESSPWSVYWCHFDGSHSDIYSREITLNSQSKRCHFGINNQLITSFEQLLNVSRDSFNPVASIHCAKILQQIMTYIAMNQQIQPDPQQGLDFNHLHEYMAQNLNTHLDLQDLAYSVNLSKYHFIKKYKAQMGTTPINYFIHLKIRRACEILDSSHHTIKEIAFSLGYDDPYYFSRVFKNVMGLSPREYREMRRTKSLM